jgi:UDP-N-acetylglucosamine 1-carboxyvinyltransferase
LQKYIISETHALKGRVKISGSKNSVLPILSASILTKDANIINEVPNLEDVSVMCKLIESLGCSVDKKGNSLDIKVNNLTPEAPFDLVSKMRASFLVVGPLLATIGHAKIYLPGGCAIGARPIDLHLKGFAALGVDINQNHGYIEAKAKKLRGAKIYLDFPSVGATENIMMAGCLAEGQTIIENAANEPEIVDLANYLISCGADIKGAGTNTIKIVGSKELRGCTHTVIPNWLLIPYMTPRSWLSPDPTELRCKSSQ